MSWLFWHMPHSFIFTGRALVPWKYWKDNSHVVTSWQDQTQVVANKAYLKCGTQIHSRCHHDADLNDWRDQSHNQYSFAPSHINTDSWGVHLSKWNRGIRYDRHLCRFWCHLCRWWLCYHHHHPPHPRNFPVREIKGL